MSFMSLLSIDYQQRTDGNTCYSSRSISNIAAEMKIIDAANKMKRILTHTGHWCFISHADCRLHDCVAPEYHHESFLINTNRTDLSLATIKSIVLTVIRVGFHHESDICTER